MVSKQQTFTRTSASGSCRYAREDQNDLCNRRPYIMQLHIPCKILCSGNRVYLVLLTWSQWSELDRRCGEIPEESISSKPSL